MTLTVECLRIATVVLAAIAGGHVLSLSPHASTSLYSIPDLGALGSTASAQRWDSAASSISNAGIIVGWTTSASDPTARVPFIYSGGTMTAISGDFGAATRVNESA